MRSEGHPFSVLGGLKIFDGDGRIRGSALRRRRRALALAVSVPALLFATAGWAQSDPRSDVVINYDVLNSLGRTVSPGTAAADQGTVALRPPPDRAPRSRLLVQPVRAAKAKASPPAPPKKAVSPVAPAATASADTAPRPRYKIETAPPVPAVSAPAPVAGAAAVPAPPPAPAVVPPPPAPPEPPVASQTPAPPEPAATVQAAGPTPSADRAEGTDRPGATQVATAPAVDLSSGPVRLLFDEGSADLSDQARSRLTALRELLIADDGPRVQLLAFAKGGEQSASSARRLSLSRALAVRAFLTERGVPASKIDVRALGTKSRAGPPDRVDVVDAKR